MLNINRHGQRGLGDSIVRILYLKVEISKKQIGQRGI